MPTKGDRVCIKGRTYEFVPTVEISGALAGQRIPGYLADTGLVSTEESTAGTTVEDSLAVLSASVEEIRKAIVGFYDYVGVYRSLKETIPKNYSNYKIDFGFPVRQFYFDTPAALTVRLNSPTADPIDVDSASSPLALNDLPNKLAFTSIYVTNANPVDIIPYIFVMG
jgi:hypothetical protein